MKKDTLFSHYKKMINLMWDEGFRKYTANELNTFVGSHENITYWKKWSNNPYYSTRSYQTELKHLGCITPIKRGLWQINAPIPEWFGSFHIKGLKGGFDLNKKYADHNCIYWKSLHDIHKVNPWKSVNPTRVVASTQPLDLNNPADRSQYGGVSAELQSLLNAARLNENQQRRDELNATLDAVKEQNMTQLEKLKQDLAELEVRIHSAMASDGNSITLTRDQLKNFANTVQGYTFEKIKSEIEGLCPSIEDHVTLELNGLELAICVETDQVLSEIADSLRDPEEITDNDAWSFLEDVMNIG